MEAIVDRTTWWGPKGWQKHLHRKLGEGGPEKAIGMRRGPPIDAYINHGRWVVDCPYCTGAEFTDREDRRFFCFNCKMVENKDRARPVRFPPKRLREQIEAILLLRPLEGTRNWTDETIAELEAENLELGV